MQASESQRRLNSSRAPWQQQHRHRRQAAVLVQLQWRDGNDVFHTFTTVRVSLWYLLLVCGCFCVAGMYCGSVVTDSANCVCASLRHCVCSAFMAYDATTLCPRPHHNRPNRELQLWHGS